MSKLELRGPATAGIKATATVQLRPGRIDAPAQVVLSTVNSVVAPPLKVKLLISNAAVPLLVIVTDRTALVAPKVVSPKFKLSGAHPMLGAVFVPTPLRWIRCWPLVPVLSMTNVPVRGKAAPGLNVRPILQLLPGGIGLPRQEFVRIVKSGAFVLMSDNPVIVNDPSPLLKTSTHCGALATLTACVPKSMRGGTARISGAIPAPLTGKECGLPAALSNTRTSAPLLPLLIGINRTPIVQVPPTGTVPQLLGSSKKSLGLPLVRITPLMISGAVPELVTVTDCTLLVVPSATSPNVGNSAGTKPRSGAVGAMLIV